MTARQLSSRRRRSGSLRKKIKRAAKILSSLDDVSLALPQIKMQVDTSKFNRAVQALKTKYDGDKLAEGLRSGIDLALKLVISEKIWEVADGRDDIIDTGALLASQSVTVIGSTIIVTYDEPYAALIHYGGYIVPYGNESASRVYLPPRPWAETVLKGDYSKYDIEAEVLNTLLDLLR